MRYTTEGKISLQTILLVIFLLILGIAGLWWFRNADRLQAGHVSEFTELEALVTPLRKLQDIALDTSILDDPLFQQLNPPTVPVGEAIELGRINPFDPIPGIVTDVTNSQLINEEVAEETTEEE